MTILINPNNVFDGLFFESQHANLGKIDDSNSFNIDINITSTEKSIFDFIISHLDSDMDAFVAGGWVRDKLLNRESKDIDIAIWSSSDTLNAALNIYRNITNENPKIINNIGTTTINIYGMDIEFTPFRKEEYSEFSNKPIISAGNLETETYRRAETINSLLYQITTGRIIDYTQRGISDIMNGIIDTPQAPEKTFREDPNRIMRVFRFAATLPNFNIHPRVLETIKRPEMLELLKPSNRGSDIDTGTKMQKATPGEENYNQLYKIMTVDNTDNLLKTLNHMVDTGVLQVLLGMDNDKWLPFDTPQMNQHHVNDSIWNHIERVFSGLDENIPENDDDKFITRMAVLFHDLGKFRKTIRRQIPEYKLQKLRDKKPDDEAIQWHGYWYTNHAAVSTQLVNKVLTENIKAPSRTKERIAILVEMHDILMESPYNEKVKKGTLTKSDAYQIAQKVSKGGINPNDVNNLIALMVADRRGHLRGDDLSDIEQFKSHVYELNENLWMKSNEVIDGNFVKSIVDFKRVGADKIGEIQNLVAYEYLNGNLKMHPEERAKQIAIERGWAISELMSEKSEINFQWLQENELIPHEKNMIRDVIKKGKQLKNKGLSNEEIVQILRNDM